MKEIKLTFAPGAFDSFTGTQEELDAIISELQRLVSSGEIWQELDPLENFSEELDSAFHTMENRVLH